MRTVLIAGGSSAPADLRELVEHGSTALVECRAADFSDRPEEVVSSLDADRVVLWSGSPDPELARIVEGLARTEAALRREILIYVQAEDAGAPPPRALPPHEVFAWPRDEDRLKMAFLTGA